MTHYLFKVFHQANIRGDRYTTGILLNKGLNGVMAFTAKGYNVSQFTANGLYLSTVVIRNFLTVNSFYG